MECVKEQVMNMMIEGKRYCLISIENRKTIKITREIFHTASPKINLININHTLKNFRRVKEQLDKEMNKIKIYL